jgi:hypothetical protein
MNGWNRLFVVVAVWWAVAAPFWLVAENNDPLKSALGDYREAVRELISALLDRGWSICPLASCTLLPGNKANHWLSA